MENLNITNKSNIESSMFITLRNLLNKLKFNTTLANVNLYTIKKEFIDFTFNIIIDTSIICYNIDNIAKITESHFNNVKSLDDNKLSLLFSVLGSDNIIYKELHADTETKEEDSLKIL